MSPTVIFNHTEGIFKIVTNILKLFTVDDTVRTNVLRLKIIIYPMVFNDTLLMI
jgi:hypothetical protein